MVSGGLGSVIAGDGNMLSCSTIMLPSWRMYLEELL
jgi:hypothetical protein